MKLNVKITNDKLSSFYLKKKNYDSDCGFDLYNDEVKIPKNSIAFPISLGVSCEPEKVQGYYLFPRSSFSKTGLILGNHIGVIDPSYRGEIIAKVHNFTDKDILLKNGSSFFQLCSPDLLPLEINFVDKLSETERGSKGFGSTSSN